jgi:hypothetical protein
MARSLILKILMTTTLLMGNVASSAETKLKDRQYYTLEATGCMILQECTDGVKEIYSMLDISSEYDSIAKFTPVTAEFNNMLSSLGDVGVKVFLADPKYFPPGHRGVYHTVSNNFYLNKAFMHRPSTLMSVMRHEGWHAAQDCMAGTIKNSLIAIIYPEESVPRIWREIAEKSYSETPSAIPWEAEATWAGKTEGMTMKALQACANGNMWEVYEPTPLTRKWLEEEGYIK